MTARDPRASRRSSSPRGAAPARSESPIRAPRDTGITLRGGLERDRRRRAAKRRARLEIAIVAAAALLALVVGWRATHTPATATGSQARAADQAAPARVAVGEANLGDPTPFFASYRSLHLYLPVPARTLTEIAFHQSSRNNAYAMDSLLPDADMNLAAKNRGTGRVVATDTVGPSVLTGSVLRMWRSGRHGAPDTAVDVGSVAGTPVFAPVTGTVLQVRPYLLYDKYPDYEIHIQPNGWPEVDVVLIHVDDPSVTAGDRVIGGITRIAQVRRLSDKVTPQMAAYTRTTGDHVHVQLNKIAVPGKLDTLDGS